MVSGMWTWGLTRPMMACLAAFIGGRRTLPGFEGGGALLLHASVQWLLLPSVRRVRGKGLDLKECKDFSQLRTCFFLNKGPSHTSACLTSPSLPRTALPPGPMSVNDMRQ